MGIRGAVQFAKLNILWRKQTKKFFFFIRLFFFSFFFLSCRFQSPAWKLEGADDEK